MIISNDVPDALYGAPAPPPNLISDVCVLDVPTSLPTLSAAIPPVLVTCTSALPVFLT